MVIVTPAEVKGTGTHEVDFVVLTSIHYALARVGMPVVQFVDNLDVQGESAICICGHGGVGTIEGLPASKFANVLAHPSRGCKGTLKKLILTCCYAGRRENNDKTAGTAVIDIFAETLKIKSLKIQGALGPSIKTTVLGEAFRVVNAPPDPTDANLIMAGDIQKDEMKKAGDALKLAGKTTKHGTNPLMDETTLTNRKMSWEKIAKKMDQGKQKDGKDYIQYKAAKYSDLSSDFFINFEKGLEKNGLLFDSHHNMRTVYWDGSKVVDVPPPKSGSCWCYITTATVASLGLPDDCDELTLLRRFRDEVLLVSPSGRLAVEEYYATAPRIVAAIDRLPHAGAIYRQLFYQNIAPAVAAIRAGSFTDAFAIYRKLVQEASALYL
jgi:hypothetical protein